MHFTPDPEVFIGYTDKVVFEVMDSGLPIFTTILASSQLSRSIEAVNQKDRK